MIFLSDHITPQELKISKFEESNYPDITRLEEEVYPDKRESAEAFRFRDQNRAGKFKLPRLFKMSDIMISRDEAIGIVEKNIDAENLELYL